MKSLLPASLVMLVAVAAAAQTPAAAPALDPKLDRAVRDLLPTCQGMTLTAAELPYKLPSRFTGTVVRVESPGHRCDTQLAAITSPTGGFYLGMPWPIGREAGATPEEKLRGFAWRNMEQNVTPLIDRTKLTPDGLVKVTLMSTTSNGKLPLMGEMDPDGNFFFFGSFRRLGSDLRAERAKAFEPFLRTSPARGAENATVTIVEFSDFECPSCQRASGYVDPILEKHGAKVRYVRYDLPLTGHPWAFPAALAGRAIYRQKPDLFWTYKKEVYANQDKLSAFTFDDFVRGFAQTHQLDLAKLDADLASEAIKNELLNGVGTAFSNDVRSTPTYLINGQFVDAGENGKGLADYVESLLK